MIDVFKGEKRDDLVLDTSFNGYFQNFESGRYYLVFSMPHNSAKQARLHADPCLTRVLHNYPDQVDKSTRDNLENFRALTRLSSLPTEQQLEELIVLTLKEPDRYNSDLATFIIELEGQPAIDRIFQVLPKFNLHEIALVVFALASKQDLRIVPYLIGLLTSPTATTSQQAATILSMSYPGAPGVDEAFEKARSNQALHDIIQEYQWRYSMPSKAKEENAITDKDRLRLGQWHIDHGEEEKGKEVLLSLANDNKASADVRLAALQYVIDLLSEQEKTSLITDNFDFLSKSALEERGVPIVLPLLRGSRKQEMLQLYIDIIKNCDLTLSIEKKIVATAAVLDLGSEVKTSVAALLESELQRIYSGDNTPSSTDPNNGLCFFDTLLAFGDREQLDRLYTLVATAQKKARSYYTPVVEHHRALFDYTPKNSTESERTVLLRALTDFELERWSQGQRFLLWTIYRLGDLKEPLAAPALLSLLIKRRLQCDLDCGFALNALINIGTPQLASQLIALLSTDDRMLIKQVTTALWRVQKANFFPAAEKIWAGTLRGDKCTAARIVGNYGGKAMFEKLVAYNSTITADRDLTRCVGGAINYMRQRFAIPITTPTQSWWQRLL